MEIMNSPHRAGVSLPQLQVTSFDIEEVAEYVTPNIETFTCTVGKKPTAAASYLNDVAEVHELLEALNKVRRVYMSLLFSVFNIVFILIFVYFDNFVDKHTGPQILFIRRFALIDWN